MFFIGLILILISIILLFVVYNKAKSVHKINTKVDKKNEEIEKRNQELEKEKSNYLTEIEAYRQNLLNIQEAMRNAGMSAEQFYKNIQQSYNNYEYSLEKDYQEKEEEYDILVKELYKSYDNEQDRILDQIKWEQSKLDNIRSTRAAAIQAQIKEREIKDQLSFYCLQPTENELDDIKKIYSPCFRKEMTEKNIVKYLINTNKTLYNDYQIYQGIVKSINDRDKNTFINIVTNNQKNKNISLCWCIYALSPLPTTRLIMTCTTMT